MGVGIEAVRSRGGGAVPPLQPLFKCSDINLGYYTRQSISKQTAKQIIVSMNKLTIALTVFFENFLDEKFN